MINKSLKNLRVWLYSRLSRDDDVEQNSLSNQKKIIREFAEQNDFTIIGESFDDNIIGMTFDHLPEITGMCKMGTKQLFISNIQIRLAYKDISIYIHQFLRYGIN